LILSPCASIIRTHCMNVDAWTELSLFESHDFVIKKFRERNARDMSAAKASEIVAQFGQAREYFESATGAGILVRPLLVYYGAVSLVRGLILFLGIRQRAATLKPSHGLSELGWREVLSSETSRLGDLRIQLEQHGTFAELAATTQNREYAFITAMGSPRFLHRTEGSKQFPPATVVTLQHLLARVPQLADLYEQTYDRLPSAYRGDVVMLAETSETRVSLFGSDYRMPSREVLKAEFSLPANLSMEIEQSYPARRDVCISFRIVHDSYATMTSQLPPTWQGPGGIPWLVAPCSHGVCLSSLSTYYVIAFVFGMLARYHPTEWRNLLRGQRGDLLGPLVREAARVVEGELPRRVASELRLAESAG
jgi:YaaC-like Protein